jgi:hypothetical protein
MAAQTSGSPKNGSPDGTPYTLYHNYYSICSIMMRYLVRIRGEPKDAVSKMNIELRNIDIFKEEQFSEEYLTKVNPNGQVSTGCLLCVGLVINAGGKGTCARKPPRLLLPAESNIHNQHLYLRATSQSSAQ